MDDSVLLTTTELRLIRSSLADAVKKIDRIIATDKVKSMPKKVLQYQEVDSVINGICSYYGITRKELQGRGRKPERVARKKIAIKVLSIYTRATHEKIASELGFKSSISGKSSLVCHHLKDINNLLSNEVYGDKEVKKQYTELIKHLGL
jgi:chromosomal replication initiation ATPase DnaA